jgi:hypothetical protein
MEIIIDHELKSKTHFSLEITIAAYTRFSTLITKLLLFLTIKFCLIVSKFSKSIL